MKTQNVTLSLPKEMLRQAKLIAVQRQISLISAAGLSSLP